MSHTYRIIPILLPALLAGAQSCVLDDEYASRPERMTITLQTDAMQTRATSPGIEALNENSVSTADIFIYANPSSAASCSLRGLSVNGGVIEATIPPAASAAIQAAGNQATVRIIANPPADFSPAGYPVRNELISARMSSPLDENELLPSIPMYGEGTAALSSGTLSGTVTLGRLLGKIEIYITDITSPDGVWQPNPGGTRASLINAVKAGTAGEPSMLRSDRFNTSRYPFYLTGGGWSPLHPFYTYPSDWSAASELSMKIILSVPWSNDGGATWRQCYYQIPVGGAAMRINANEHHRTELSISILGSFEEAEPTPLEPSFIVQNWGSESTATNISDIRYLVVETNEAELDNITHFEDPYYSSHAVTISSCTLTHTNLLSGTTETVPEDGYTCELTGDRLIFEHALDNDGTASSDYAPYVLSVTIAHEDRPAYNQTITVTQYPAINVEAKPNSGSGVYNSKGYAYVNNGSGGSYGGNPSGNGTTSNYNMYLITITKLQPSSEYIIGDPRERTINNLPTSGGWGGSNWSSNTYDLNGTRRRLSYYHPTESGSRTVNMLAPQFRVASSYGACTKISYENAQRRCASYQEDGIPAGRWRVPTAAEVQYIIDLSEKGIIPALFTINYGGNGYWCANGSITADADNHVLFTENDYSGTHSVRCVYDEWYWGDYQISPRTNFRWGDQNTF